MTLNISFFGISNQIDFIKYKKFFIDMWFSDKGHYYFFK